MIHRSKVKLMRGYEVETCIDLPKDAHGDTDFDRAKYQYDEFATIEAARKHARTVLPSSPFGCVLIRGFTMEPISDRYPDVLSMEYTEAFEEVS